jgi:hypothetical protein
MPDVNSVMEVGVMPRETIYSDQQFNVSVGWWPDRDVQVGITTTQDQSLLQAIYGHDDTLQRLGDAYKAAFGSTQDSLALGKQLLQLVDGASDHPYESVWSTLGNRTDPNRLIKVLRKARDAAFGRDE